MGALAGEKLAEQGANVALLDVNEESLEAVAARIRKAGGKVMPLKVDIRRYPEVEDAANRIVEAFGSLDILLNCAGGMSGRCCHDLSSFEKLPIEVIDWGASRPSPPRGKRQTALLPVVWIGKHPASEAAGSRAFFKY